MTWLSGIFAFAENIPPAFWGVVAGSFLTLGGVILTNRANDRRSRAQFLHDQGLRSKERELGLRKEIYLAGAEAISAGLRAVGSLANLDLSYQEITQPYIEKAPAIAKAHIIGNEETLTAVATISAELHDAFVRLAAKRIPLNQMKQNILILDQQIATFGIERDRILGLIIEHNIEGNPDARRLSVLQKNFEFEQKRVLDRIKERDASALALSKEQLVYTEECLRSSRQLATLVVPAVLAIRKELELPIDGVLYGRLMDDLLTKQQTATAQFIGEMRSLLDRVAVSSHSAQDASKGA